MEALDRLLGPLFFYLAVIFLILGAGVIHRLGRGSWTAFEADVMAWSLLTLWPVFVCEALLRLVACRRPGVLIGRRCAAFLMVCLFPPLRLAGRAYADSTRTWLPFLGWTTVDSHLRGRLERFISVPMMIVTVLVLPLLAMEHFWLEQVRGHFGLSLLLDVGTSAIWLAFALELIVMAGLADDKVQYCSHNWVNLAVVALPLFDFLPILRLLRLTRLLEVQQMGRLARLYRLRFLLVRIWRAVLLLEIIQRLLGNYRVRHLKRLKRQLAAREEEVACLRQEIAEAEVGQSNTARTKRRR
jgi:voltage-gated potassium channel